MPYGLYLSAAGAHVQSKRMEVISNNLANVDTAGFKRELAVAQARHTEAIEQGEATPGEGGVDDLSGGVRFQQTLTDHSHGAMKQTGVETDMAIDGEGYFVVDRDGEPLLTRAGNFSLTGEGRLVTQSGMPVLAADGNPIDLNPALPWHLEESGVIVQGGAAVPLAVVQPESPRELKQAGDTLFSAENPPEPVPLAERRIRGGYLEQSTVQPVREMMNMIEATRAYEANVKLIQNQDHMIGQLVGRVLRQG